MSWFDEQIKMRKLNDDEVFQDSFIQMADAVLGSRMAAALNDERTITKNAIDEILKYYHVKSRDIPDTIKDMNDQLEFLLRPSGIMHRTVRLESGWYKNAIGAMIAQRKDGSVVALIPKGYMYYDFLDLETGKRIRVNKKNEELFEEEALCFYKPFPLKKLKINDLMQYMFSVLSFGDYFAALVSTAAVTFVGMLMPRLNKLLFSDVLESGSIHLLIALMISMIFISIGTIMIRIIKTMLLARINTKLDLTVGAATMMRVLSLRAEFFKEYGSGELASRVTYMNSLCNVLINTLLSTGLTSVWSIAYVAQIFQYAPGLVVPAISIIVVTFIYSIVSTVVQIRISRQQMLLSTQENNISYAMINGVQKIKLSGSEKRMFSRWGNLYAKVAKLQYDPPMFIKLNTVISTAITLIGTLVITEAAIRTHVSVSDYYAFNTAYAMVSAAFMQLSSVALMVATIKPTLEMIQPIMDAVPEVSEGKLVLDKVNGNIELNNVSFRYNDNMPNVIDNMTLKIRSGQYVAIVGKTGCGKSTLMRLLLGFEKPQKGAIYYDGKDIETIDLKSLRRKIGSVMQNSGLFTGEIFSNIVISAPWLTLDDAWEAAELAGIADDIRKMPMGMNTLISEGQGGISGGQRQRLMIARAIAPKPTVLMFDEATSALDNITQKKVSESLDRLKCTRVVIAHRLSTIQHCDRIIVLDHGTIIEDGTYEELIAKKGFFSELVERQRLDHAISRPLPLSR